MSENTNENEPFSQPDQPYNALSEFESLLFSMNPAVQDLDTAGNSIGTVPAVKKSSDVSNSAITDSNEAIGALDDALNLQNGTPDTASNTPLGRDDGEAMLMNSSNPPKRQRVDLSDSNFSIPLNQNNALSRGTPTYRSETTSPQSTAGTPSPSQNTSSSKPNSEMLSNSGNSRLNSLPAPHSKTPSVSAPQNNALPSRNGNSTTTPLEIKKMTDVKSRACDECRRRKTACYYLNSESSKCFRCQMESIECTFNSPSKVNNNSSSAGGNRSVPIPARAAPKQPVVSGLMGLVEDYSQLPGRSLLKKTLSLQHPRSSFAIGQYGLWDQRVLQSIPLDKSNQARLSQNLSLRKVGPDSWFMIRNEAGHNDWIRECDLIERMVYPYGRALVNSFFMFVHREYPILHEKIFIEKYLRTYRELMPALLGSVYLLGMRWWNHNAELSTVSRPDNIIPALYDATLTNFFKSSGCSSLSLIQSGLLLLQCSFADPLHLSICSVINAAAFRLALNRNCLHWKLPRWEINLRIRLSWATYMQATWICLFDSIPPLIHDDSWFLSPFNADVFENGATELLHNGAFFIQMNKLSLIVHDMHNMLSSKLLLMYSSEISATQTMINNANVNATSANHGYFGSSRYRKNMQSSSTSPEPSSFSAERSAEDIIQLIKPIQLRLHDWYANVPPALLNLEGEHPTGNFSLRIAYISAEVILHRFIIRVSCSDHARLTTDMIKLLRSTARERLDVAYKLIKLLKPQHLQQFWYFTVPAQFAVIGVFASLMYTTSETKAESEYYLSLLRDYINQLQIYSDNDVMGAALRTLRSSIAGVPGLVF